jgi:hypothetical protein
MSDNGWKVTCLLSGLNEIGPTRSKKADATPSTTASSLLSATARYPSLSFPS